MARQRLVDMMSLPMQHIVRYPLHLTGEHLAKPWARVLKPELASHTNTCLSTISSSGMKEIIKKTPAHHPDAAELGEVLTRFGQLLA